MIVVIQFLFPSTCLLCDFHLKNGKKQKIAIFSTGNPSWKVVKELHGAVTENPEEVAVGTDPYFD